MEAAAAPCVFLSLVLLMTVSAPVSPAPALKLPDYIKPCSRNDPKLNECALKHALPAIPFLLKGVPKFNVPALTPLKVAQIKVDGGEGSVGLSITVNDANFFGFKEAVIKETNFDLAKKQAEIKASVPVGQLLGKYEVGGKILLLPITGKGNANVTLVDLELTFTVNWELEKREDGKEYIKPVSSDIKYDMSRAYVQLDGLFGGDKTLAHYIKPCSRNDPKLNECAYKHALPAIPFLLKGDAKYKVPVLTPLKVTEIKVDGGEGSVGLSITLHDVSFHGFKEANAKQTNFDLTKKQAEIKASVPVGQLLGKYEVGGKILLLPITGSGDANITLVDLDLAVTVHWELEKRQDGKEYIKPLNSEIKYDMSRAYMHLDGLFGGDKALGDNMNMFLNENWQDVVKEIGPAVAEALAAVVTQILSGITHLVPYDELFPETV